VLTAALAAPRPIANIARSFAHSRTRRVTRKIAQDGCAERIKDITNGLDAARGGSAAQLTDSMSTAVHDPYEIERSRRNLLLHRAEKRAICMP
jgi:hypothetical protein